MPPAKKTATSTPLLDQGLLKIGAIVNLEKGGRTLTNLEVLDYDDRFIKFRWDMHVAPQTEVVIMPWNKVESIGLVGER